jgi:hypothetical protein
MNCQFAMLLSVEGKGEDHLVRRRMRTDAGGRAVSPCGTGCANLFFFNNRAQGAEEFGLRGPVNFPFIPFSNEERRKGDL